MMVYRRDHNQTDIETLAQKFRKSWNVGELIRPWLRRNGEELRALVRDEDWAWENIGKALSLAGIAFKTGNARTGENLRRSVALALKPRKGRGRPAAKAAMPPTPETKGGPEFRVIRRGPGTSPPISDEEAIAIAQGHSQVNSRKVNHE
jgi:hypothetical protein